MNKKKQLLFTITGILLICILFSTAMIFPKYFNLYRDSKILNKTEYINVNNDMYEVSYTSFTDKLNAIAKCRVFGIEIHSVKINDTGFSVDNKSINKIVKKEFNSLYQSGALYKKIKLNASKISSCETFTLYTSDTKNGIKGIVYRKIVYKKKAGDITVYFDEEYHKIYEIILPLSLYFPKNTSVTPTQIYKEMSNSIYDTDSNYFSNLLYATMDGFFSYYNVTGDIQENRFYPSKPNCIGSITFDDDSVITLEGITFQDSSSLSEDGKSPNLSDNLSIKIGINLGDIQ